MSEFTRFVTKGTQPGLQRRGLVAVGPGRPQYKARGGSVGRGWGGIGEVVQYARSKCSNPDFVENMNPPYFCDHDVRQSTNRRITFARYSVFESGSNANEFD